MKKIILVAGMFYAATSGAMATRVLGTALSPIIVPGIYYGAQTYFNEQAFEKNWKGVDQNSPKEDQLQRQRALEKSRAPLTEYMKGVYKGLELPFNLFKAADDANTQIPDIENLSARERAGLFGAGSAYGTALGLLSLIKRLK
jgi:hypothetical protein